MLDDIADLPSTSPLPAQAERRQSFGIGWRVQKIPFRIVCISLGLLLLIAAGMKLQHASWEPFGQALIIPARVRIILIEVEAILGLWLLSCRASVLLRPVAAAYFAVLAAVSLFLAVNGEPSCGCFGDVTVNPWIAFAIDIGAATLLAGLRPVHDRANGLSLLQRHRPVLAWLVTGLIVIVAGTVVAHGGIAPAWFALLGDPVSVYPPVTDLGHAVRGTNREFTVTLHNHLPRQVRILGGTSDCSCAAAEDMPVTLPPGGMATVRVKGAFKGAPGSFVREFVFYTDQGLGHNATARFRGRVLAKASAQP
jgi:hypothetical protein